MVVLLLPTVVLVRLRLPKLTLLMEGITILPIVVPPIVIAAGLAELQGSAPQWLVKLWFNHPLTGLTPIYVVLAMPFSYRAFDTRRARDRPAHARRRLAQPRRIVVHDDDARDPAERRDRRARSGVPDGRARAWARS